MDYNRYLEFALNHYILSLALAVVTYLLIQELFDTAFKKFAALSPLLAVAKMNNEQVVIIDVREPLEFTESHIEDAKNTPLSKFVDYLPGLETYKKTPLLVACQTGTRSATAAKMLTKAGFEQVFVITGGMAAWENDYKLPVKISKNKKKA
ncbi:rhodanese-like domain-containing protein [Methylovulum psychrotolerans]|jgi:rhodanese-related sulfurtransferase|uniref:Rhodanese-like domain-containing protein n=1 Tax=Methylovulum psychrotolerans TaxID=1704499 RepID=A0A1Z4BWZ5_9GAMM|nr:rhodanese-like domain-containing protein [Methylovulum psychrotolerans]ASF45770.1 sulfurtransferase [Methylovulum psychrotolerans]MBT9097301.1 rhodanese-like domain-containing protein [Methylovulum psychrotolerans]POZ51779.1 rhodanese-like domain-containing protein [Methylovulum psychrotolerans]